MSKSFDSPISVEKFAAYLDGNLPQTELKQISRIIETNHELFNLAETSKMLDEDVDYGCEIPDTITNGDFDLPSVDICQDEIDFEEIGDMFIENDFPDIGDDGIFDDIGDGDIDL